MMPIKCRGWAILVAMGLIGCGGGNPSGSGAGEDGRAAADKFLEDLRAGRIEPAWQGTTTEFKSLMGLGSLKDLAKTRPALKGTPEHIDSKRIDRGGLSLVEHTYRAQGKTKNKAIDSTLRVIVSRGDRGWQVEKLSVE
ncbi:MAG: hypothetical protein U0800_18880 [Isosphaeraceae bacterium]